jgi:hypothetical protein
MGRTALHWAAAAGLDSVFEPLLQAAEEEKARIKAQYQRGERVVINSKWAGHVVAASGIK